MAARKPSPQKDAFVEGLNQPLNFQRHEWLVQRIGWVLMLLIILAGALGLFGNGPLAQRSLSNNALQLDFEWLARRDAPTTWKVRPRTAPVDGVYRVALDANWGQYFRINAIQPVPDSTRIANGRWIYEFTARAGDAPIVFHVEPQRLGTLAGSIQLNDAPPLELTQFIYP